MSTSRPSGGRAAAAHPAWLEQAPDELRAVLQIGFERFGDDPVAIAGWLSALHDYRVFWDLVERQSPHDVLTAYAGATTLRGRIAEARQHPERRVARPPRRTA